MARLWYEPHSGGTELKAWNDPDILVKTEMEDRLAAYQTFRGLDDISRGYLAQGGIPGAGIPAGWATLEAFDEYLDDEIERLRDILDYFDYGSKTEQITVRDGSWWSPEAVEAVSGEEAGSEAGLSIDGDNGTWWQSNDAGLRWITYRIRDYRKQIEKIRLRTTSGDLRCQLQNVTIKLARTLSKIDDPESVMETGVNFTYAGDAWMEHTLPKARRWRYMKLECSDTLNANDHVRIREVQAFVIITNHER